MKCKNKKYLPSGMAKSSGYLCGDLMVSLAVLGFLFGGFASSLDGFRRFNHYQLVRQQCVAAAQAELDSIAKLGKPVSNEDINRLWPKLTVSIQRSPGIGQWKGLQLVEATVSGQSFNRRVQVKLSRYILEGQRGD